MIKVSFKFYLQIRLKVCFCVVSDTEGNGPRDRVTKSRVP